MYVMFSFFVLYIVVIIGWVLGWDSVIQYQPSKPRKNQPDVNLFAEETPRSKQTVQLNEYFINDMFCFISKSIYIHSKCPTWSSNSLIFSLPTLSCSLSLEISKWRWLSWTVVTKLIFRGFLSLSESQERGSLKHRFLFSDCFWFSRCKTPTPANKSWVNQIN